MIDTAKFYGLIVMAYAILSIVRLKYFQRRIPVSLIIANVLFLFFYCINFSYHMLNIMRGENFILASASFYYSFEQVQAAFWALLSYIIVFEVINASTLVFYQRRLQADLHYTMSPSASLFGTVFIVLCIICGVLLSRIQGSMGLFLFVKNNVLRSVVYEGLGVVLELLFVVTLISTIFLVSVPRQRARWTFLFALSSIITFARWPILLLILAGICERYYLRGRVFLNVRYLLFGVIFVMLSVAVVVLTRPTGDTFDGPLQAIFGTEQAPQIAALLVAVENDQILSRLSDSPVGFFGEVIPKALKSNFGIIEGDSGNVIFTESNWKLRLDNTQSELSIGGINELYLRGGILLCLIVLFLFPLMYVFLFTRLRNVSELFVVETAACWFIFQLLRSDLAHTFSRVPGLVVGVVISVVILRWPQRSSLRLTEKEVG